MILELVFIFVFVYSLTIFNNNHASVLRILTLTTLIFLTFFFHSLIFNKVKLKNILNLSVIFFITLSFIQTTRNIFTLGGSYVLISEITHYFLTLFILSYNFKKPRHIETGLVLFIIYSFRIFDASISDTEFALVNGLSLILALHWLEELSLQKISLTKVTSVFIPIITLIIIIIFSTLKAVCPYTSLVQMGVMINFIFIAFLIANYVKDTKQINLILFAYFFIGSILSILILSEILQSFFKASGYYRLNRIWIDIDSPFRIHPNSIAGYFLSLLCLVVGNLNFYKKSLIRICAIVSIVIMCVILLLTYSRLGIASFIFALFILFLLKYRKDKGSVKTILLSLLVIAASIAGLIFLRPVRQLINQRIFNYGSSLQTFYSCKLSLIAIKDSSLLGFGLDNYYILSKYAKDHIAGLAMESTRNVICTPSHSLYIGIAFGLGILGLLVFLWFLISIIAYFIKLNKYISNERYESGLATGFFAAFIAIIIHGILAMSYHLTILPAFFWVFSGSIIAIGNVTNFNNKVICVFKLEKFFIVLFILLICGICFTINPLLGEKFFVSASKNFNLGELDKALSSVNQAKKFMPLNPKFYELSAEIKNAEGSAEESREAYKRALALKPDFAFYYTKLGQLYRQEKKFANALMEFKRAINLDKFGVCYQEHYSDLGSLYREIGDKEQAIEQFKMALLMQPKLAEKADWEGAGFVAQIAPDLNRVNE